MPNKTHLSPIKSFSADYSVVLITNNSDELIRRFINTQKYLGASKFFIYMDREFEQGNFASIENAEFISTKTKYSLGIRPKKVNRLQRIVYQDAYSKCETTWLAVMDFDECIFHANLPMKKFLKQVPSDVDYILARTHEAFWGEFENSGVNFSANFCRCPSGNELLESERQQFYGRNFEHTYAHGLAGHTTGKYIVRTGLDMKLNVHEANHSTEKKRVDHPLGNVGVLHFDAPSFRIWHKKFGSGKPLSIEDKTEKNRRLTVQAIRANLFDKNNTEIFKELYCWSKKKRNDYLEFGDVYELSWKWGALTNFSSVSEHTRIKYHKLVHVQNIKFKIMGNLEWLRPIFPVLRNLPMLKKMKAVILRYL